MTSPLPTSRRGPLLAAAGIAVAVLAAAGLWYLFLRPAGPAPVAIGTTPPAAATEAPASVEASSAAPGASAGASDAASTDPGVTGDGIAGTWTVDPSIGSFDDFSSSFVGYRVREELASIGATEAVGRTPDVTGSMTVDGTTITAAEFTVDLTTLQSDETNRDRQLGRQGLQTSQFPTGTFVLTQPVDLGAAPTEGETVDATVTGDLTLHGATNQVEIPLQAKLEGGVVTVVGSLPILFADYGMDPPSSFVVLSVEDNGTMEFQLHFTRA